MTQDEVVKKLCEAPSCLSKSKARELLNEYRKEVRKKDGDALVKIFSKYSINWAPNTVKNYYKTTK